MQQENTIDSTINVVKDMLNKLIELKSNSSKLDSQYKTLFDKLNAIESEVSEIKKAVIG